MLCVGGPLDGQDYTVKGDRFVPAFFIREYRNDGTRTHEYVIEKLYADASTPFDIAEPRYTFVARHASLPREQAERIIERDHMQKFVDSLIFSC